jgi:hypothetical protein
MEYSKARKRDVYCESHLKEAQQEHPEVVRFFQYDDVRTSKRCIRAQCPNPAVV